MARHYAPSGRVVRASRWRKTGSLPCWLNSDPDGSAGYEGARRCKVDARIGIIGCGTMGQAILGGLLAADEVDASSVVVTLRWDEDVDQLRQRFGVVGLRDNAEAARRSDIVLLCVKPQVAEDVLADPDLRDALDGKLLISICAGLELKKLVAWVPGAAVIRAMPNTPCLIREGMTVISAGPGVTPTHVASAEAIFSSVGRCRVLEEKHLNAVTGLSGSGPAFACVMLEAMADGGVMMGLPRDVAVELAAQTMQGAARLVLHTGEHPAALKDRVTTPAGCTIAGLLIMEDGRIRSTLARTIQESSRVASGLAD